MLKSLSLFILPLSRKPSYNASVVNHIRKVQCSHVILSVFFTIRDDALAEFVDYLLKSLVRCNMLYCSFICK